MRVATIVSGVGAIAVLGWLLFPTEEALIMRRLEHLVGVLNESSADSPFARDTYGDRVASFFSTGASIRFGDEVREIYGRDAVARFVSRWRRLDDLLDVTFLNMSFNFDRRLLIAQGKVAVHVNGSSPAGKAMEGRYFLDVVLRQLDGRWFVQELRTADQS